MIELDSIHQGATWRYQVDITPDDLHTETLTIRLGTTKDKLAVSGTPDKIATGSWGAYTALHTIGTLVLTAADTAALTLGLYYFEIVSSRMGGDVHHLGGVGAVQVVI